MIARIPWRGILAGVSQPSAALFLLILLAFALRVYKLDAQELWGDEAASVAFSGPNLHEIVVTDDPREPHPPLYYYLLHYWMSLAGEGEFSLRFPSLFFGLLIIPLLYTLGRELLSSKLGLLAAALVTINPFQIWYAQEARMYGLLTALSLASMVALLRLLRRGGVLPSLAYLLPTFLSLLTHYFALFLLLSQNLFLLLHWHSSGRPAPIARRWLALQGLLFLLYLPWTLLGAASILRSTPPQGGLDLVAALESLGVRPLLGRTLDPELARWLVLALLPLFLAGLPLLRKKGATALLLLYLLVPVASALVLSLRRPLFNERYLMLSTPALYLVLAAGLLWVKLPALRLAYGLLLFAASAASLGNLYYGGPHKGSYSSMTQEIAAYARQGEAVILNGSSQWYLYDYYRERELPHYILPTSVPLDKARTQAELENISARHSGLWLLQAGTADYDPEGFVERWLSTNLYPGSCRWSAPGRICYYGASSTMPQSYSWERRRFGGELTLEGYRSPTGELGAGDFLTVDLLWQAETMADDYKVFLHMRDAAGHLWAQSDSPPLGGFAPTSSWRAGERILDRRGLRIEPGTPPGRYSLVLGVYSPANGQRLTIMEGNRSLGSETILGPVEVLTPTLSFPLAALKLERPRAALFGEKIKMLGHSLPQVLRPGLPISLKVFWEAQGGLEEDYRVSLRLRRANEAAPISETILPLSPYPPKKWLPEAVVAAIYDFLPEPRLGSGDYWLELALLKGDGYTLPVREGGQEKEGLRLGQVKVEARQRGYRLPSPQYPLQEELGPFRFLGYDLDPSPARRGGSLSLTLYWQALEETQRNLTVFTHLLDASDRVVAQHDGIPQGGLAPTSDWLRGEVIADRHQIPLSSAMPSGDHQIEIGLYEAATGERLRNSRAQDRILLGRVKVEP